MTSLIREAAGRTTATEGTTPRTEPEPVGRIGAGLGHSADAPLHVEEPDDVNEQLRRRWKVITGRVDLDTIGNW
jgi:hypothetical protein